MPGVGPFGTPIMGPVCTPIDNRDTTTLPCGLIRKDKRNVSVGRLVIVIASLGIYTTADAKDAILCVSKNAPEVVITLNAERMLTRNVSCISGEFVVDMTPCAPNGGYGLSYPTGEARLSRIVSRWQDYGNHHGG